jgi:hypothetical protein
MIQKKPQKFWVGKGGEGKIRIYGRGGGGQMGVFGNYEKSYECQILESVLPFFTFNNYNLCNLNFDYCWTGLKPVKLSIFLLI